MRLAEQALLIWANPLIFPKLFVHQNLVGDPGLAVSTHPELCVMNTLVRPMHRAPTYTAETQPRAGRH